ncbi:MAG: hypothetical protein R3330_06060, partial [Saprospiraceae bacterium]|nr:hypothetical protein [Saprospiraceae bacterium]
GETGTLSGSEEIENIAMREIAIDVLPCDPEGASRASALLVYSLTDNNLEVFSYDRYTVSWYGYDGSLLSEEYKLECVAGGNYFVHVLDDITGAEGRASISL